MNEVNVKLASGLAVLLVKDLNFSYGQKPIFTALSMRLPRGISFIKGGDGRGKSTLLRLLAGTLRAQSGQLLINAIDLQQRPENYKAQIFWAEPRADSHDQLTVQEYFELQRRNYAGFSAAVLAEVVSGLSLSEHLHKQLFMLSTGSKRKVFIAAAFASYAALTLLDTPFAALDAPSTDFILNWLHRSAAADQRAWVIADYTAPDGLPLVQVIDLGE